MFSNVKKSLLFFLIGSFAVSCLPKKSEQKSESETVEYHIEQSTKNDSLAYELGIEIENLIAEGNADGYISKIDFDHFVDLVTKVEGSDSKLAQYKKGFKKGFGNGLKQVPEQIILEVENMGFYDFISSNYNGINNSYSILFRLFSEEGGINYHDYQIIEDKGAFLIGDIYIYTTGENLSESMNKIFLAALPKNILERILKLDGNEDMTYFISAYDYKNKGQLQMALDELDRVKGGLRKKKIFQVVQTQIASGMDESLYMKAMEELKATFPNDPSTNLLLVDYYILKENYQEALNALNKLKSDTGDDFVDYIIGNVHIANSDFKQADNFFQNIVEAYPDYWMVKLNLLTTKSKIGDYEESLKMLDALIEDEIFLISEAIDYVHEKDENGDNILSGLAESDQFQKWKNNLN